MSIDELFQFHFMTNALIAGGLVAVTASAIGWFMVVRRQTFAGHTLSLIAFPGAAAAALAGGPVFVGYAAGVKRLHGPGFAPTLPTHVDGPTNMLKDELPASEVSDATYVSELNVTVLVTVRLK